MQDSVDDQKSFHFPRKIELCLFFPVSFKRAINLIQLHLFADTIGFCAQQYESICNAGDSTGDVCSISGLGRCPGEGNATLL